MQEWRDRIDEKGGGTRTAQQQRATPEKWTGAGWPLERVGAQDRWGPGILGSSTTSKHARTMRDAPKRDQEHEEEEGEGKEGEGRWRKRGRQLDGGPSV